MKIPPCRRAWAAAGGVALHACHEQGRKFLIKKRANAPFQALYVKQRYFAISSEPLRNLSFAVHEG